VLDKSKISALEKYGEVVYISKLINSVGMLVSEENITILENDPNIISLKESREGTFQPCTVS